MAFAYEGLLQPDEEQRIRAIIEAAGTRGANGTFISQSTSYGLPATSGISAPVDVNVRPQNIPHADVPNIVETSEASADLTGMEILGMLSLSTMPGKEDYKDLVLNYILESADNLEGDINLSERAQVWLARKNREARKKATEQGLPLHVSIPPAELSKAIGRFFPAVGDAPYKEKTHIDLEGASSLLAQGIDPAVAALLSKQGVAPEYWQDWEPGEDQQALSGYPAVELHEFQHRAFELFRLYPALLDGYTYYNPKANNGQGSYEPVKQAILKLKNGKWSERRDLYNPDDKQSYPEHQIIYSSGWRTDKQWSDPRDNNDQLEYQRLRFLSKKLNKIALKVVQEAMDNLGAAPSAPSYSAHL